MSYIGNPIVSTDFPVDYFSGNGSTTAFTLSIAPASVNAVDVLVSGVSQSPQTYTISGTTLTFSAAPPSGTSNIVVKHRGIAGSPNVPSAASVGPTQINGSYSLWNLSGADVNYTAGNVGVGTSSPTQKVSTTATSSANGFDIQYNGSYQIASWTINPPTGEIRFGGTNTTGTYFQTFYTQNTERMRIASSGELLMSKTAIDTTGAGSYFEPAASLGYARLNMIKNSSSGTSATPAIAFYYSGTGGVGSIQCTSTATAYNTSSDYRLKENIAPMTGALQTVSLLKPVTYNWKTDGSNGQGFIAHELQAIIPDAVCGEKDAIDKDGNPIYQGIDTSFLVATLTAAIQELNAKVTTLEATTTAQAAEIAALKGIN